MRFGERVVVLAVGETGRGKTTALRSLTARTERLLVADVTGDFATDVDESFTSAAELAEAVRERHPDQPFRFRLALDLDGAAYRAYTRDPKNEPNPLELAGAQVAALGFATGCCAIVLDELRQWCSSSWIHPNLNLALSMGRHRGLSILATTRRPSEVHRLASSQVDLLLAFQTVEPLDLAYLSSRLGARARELPALEPFSALAVGNGRHVLEVLGSSRLDPRIELLGLTRHS